MSLSEMQKNILLLPLLIWCGSLSDYKKTGLSARFFTVFYISSNNRSTASAYRRAARVWAWAGCSRYQAWTVTRRMGIFSSDLKNRMILPWSPSSFSVRTCRRLCIAFLFALQTQIDLRASLVVLYTWYDLALVLVMKTSVFIFIIPHEMKLSLGKNCFFFKSFVEFSCD